MKLPRDVSGSRLIKELRKLGYEVTRQKGSHARITTHECGDHHDVVPNHHPLKVGTLSSLLKSIATHHRLSLEELIQLLNL